MLADTPEYTPRCRVPRRRRARDANATGAANQSARPDLVLPAPATELSDCPGSLQAKVEVADQGALLGRLISFD